MRQLAVVDVDARPAAARPGRTGRDVDFLSLVETAKRLGAKAAVAAWRSQARRFSGAADAFLALDDDDAVDESDDEEDTTTTRAAPLRIASPSPPVPAQLSISTPPLARRRRCRRSGEEPGRRVGAGAARRGDGERRWRRRARAASRNRPDSTPSRSASANRRHPSSTYDEEQDSSELETGELETLARRRWASGVGVAPSLRRTPRRWGRPTRRGTRLDSDSGTARPGRAAVKWPRGCRAASRGPPLLHCRAARS